MRLLSTLTIVTTFLPSGLNAQLYASTNSSLPPLPLPSGVESSYVDCSNTSGLIFHVLSSGYDPSQQKPLILLLHGAPELAFSWRHIIAPLAEQGYFVVAPDQRGYGRTTGWDTRSFDYVDLTEFYFSNLVRDLVSLVHALGYESVYSVISHDFGTMPGTWGPILRPDIFTSAIQVSIPFTAPNVPTAIGMTTNPPATFTPTTPFFALLEDSLEALSPPRKHYQWYHSLPTAAADWLSGGSLGLTNFFKGYLYVKSHQWPGNAVITPPANLTAQQLAIMPHYQIMLKNQTMPETVTSMLNGASTYPIASWIPDSDVDVFVSEFARTGFQGDLNWYRVLTSTAFTHDELLISGQKIRVPNAFITGANDWSSYLSPGAIAAYNQTATDFRGVTTIPESGHWVPEEQPGALLEAILKFLGSL